jgi:hypothetical protein
MTSKNDIHPLINENLKLKDEIITLKLQLEESKEKIRLLEFQISVNATQITI